MAFLHFCYTFVQKSACRLTLEKYCIIFRTLRNPRIRNFERDAVIKLTTGNQQYVFNEVCLSVIDFDSYLVPCQSQQN